MAMPTFTTNSMMLSKFDSCRTLVVRITSRGDCVWRWWLRMWPETNALTAEPHESDRTTWRTRFADRSRNIGEWMALWVMTAHRKDRTQVAAKRGNATTSDLGEN